MILKRAGMIPLKNHGMNPVKKHGMTVPAGNPMTGVRIPDSQKTGAKSPRMKTGTDQV